MKRHLITFLEIRSIVILVSTFVALNAIPTYARTAGENKPGVFDYYILNLSWEPQFCRSTNDRDSEECQYKSRGFVVHGLWPQYNSGFPEYCSHTPGPADPRALLDVTPTISLIEHEWHAHGTCSGLNADDYFALMRRAYESISIPEKFAHPSVAFSITPQEIKQAFITANAGLEAQDMVVSCGNNSLTAVQFCLNKQTLRPISCSAIRDCHANSVKVVQ